VDIYQRLNMNSEDFTDKYCNDIIASRHEYIKCVKEKRDYRNYQQNNFRLISNLVSDLFHHKNSRDTFQTLSNLIIVTLNSREPYLPVDIYSSKSREERGDQEHKEALRKELQKSKFKPNQTLDMKQKIQDIFTRFLKQYDRIDNIEFAPRIRKNGNGFPN